MSKRGATRRKGADPDPPEPSLDPEAAEPGQDPTDVHPEATGDGPKLTEEERLRLERDEAVNSWRRAQADYQNLRRRQQADIDSAVSRSREGLLAELLLVLDYLDMALQTECQTDEGRNLLVGVEMTRHQMIQFLEQQGVALLPDGGAFDTETHQAIETVASPSHAPGDIVETIRKGYRIGDRMLRHAQVKVAADPNAEGGATDGTDDGPSQEGAGA